MLEAEAEASVEAARSAAAASVSEANVGNEVYTSGHGLRTPREEKAFTARPKIQSQSLIFRYG